MSSRPLSLFDDTHLPEQVMPGDGNSIAMKDEDKLTEQGNTVPKKHAPKKLPAKELTEKNYYTIGEVAAYFGVNTSHIRFWTNEFVIKVRTTRKGDRLYTPEQIKELKKIYHLVKERGFTIAGAKAKLKADKKADVQPDDLKDSLQQLRKKLILLRNKLT